MKKTLIFFVITLAFNFSYGQSKVYFIRESQFAGSVLNAPINIDNERCGLQNGTFTVVELKPDTYTFSTGKHKHPIKMKLDSGTYYFNTSVITGLMYSFKLNEITERAALVILDQEKLKAIESCF